MENLIPDEVAERRLNELFQLTVLSIKHVGESPIHLFSRSRTDFVTQQTGKFSRTCPKKRSQTEYGPNGHVNGIAQTRTSLFASICTQKTVAHLCENV